MRHDPLRIRRSLVLIPIARSLRRWLHILPRQFRPAHAHQWHHLRHLHHHPVRRSIRRRSRVRCTIHRRSTCRRSSHHLNGLGVSAATHNYLVRQHHRHRFSKRQHQNETKQGNRHAIPLDPGPRSSKSILSRIHPFERKYRRLHDQEPAEGPPRPVHLLPRAQHHRRNNAMSHRATSI